MLKIADAIVILVGGLGTIDEATDMLEHKKHRRHNKPMIVLNTDNFYEGLKVQLLKMHTEGCLPRPIDDLIIFAENPSDAINQINNELKVD